MRTPGTALRSLDLNRVGARRCSDAQSGRERTRVAGRAELGLLIGIGGIVERKETLSNRCLAQRARIARTALMMWVLLAALSPRLGTAACTPIETREPNAADQRPAFSGQTRACSVKS